MKVKMGMFKPTPLPPVPQPPSRNLSLLEDDLLQIVNQFGPGLIAITSTSGTYPMGLKCSRIVKQHFSDIPVIMGGIHPTICPEEVIQEPSVDMICIGEGEDALLELCDAIESHKMITAIQNLWIKNSQSPEVIQRNPLRPFKNLDTLPLQDFSDFHEYELYRPLDGNIYKMINTELSRGCV